MKKIIRFSLVILIYICLIDNHKGSAQGAFHQGDNLLGFGIGFGSALGAGGYDVRVPPISVQYEHGNWAVGGPGVISLGGYLGYASFGHDDSYYGYNYRWNYTIIGIRSAYHFNMINSKDWDLYGGVMLSYDVVSFSSSNPFADRVYDYGSGIFFSLYIGGRYFVSPNVALFSELGYGISYFNLGAAFRI